MYIACVELRNDGRERTYNKFVMVVMVVMAAAGGNRLTGGQMLS